MINFAFGLEQRVRFRDTNTWGSIIARSQSLRCANEYLVEFVNNGEIKEQWVFEDQLQTFPFDK